MSNSYLKIAEMAIREMGRPLHPKEIIEVARNKGIIPQHLFGRTQYKTLAARLSTEIRENSGRSLFFRTSANRFFLRDMKSERHYEYKAPRRQKTLHNERVLTITTSFLNEVATNGLIKNMPQVVDAAFQTNNIQYVVRKYAERRFDIKQVIAYALIYRDRKLLTYRRGIFSSAADELQGKRSIGFGGHVSDEDINLFDARQYGVFENVRRELQEELVFTRRETENLQNPSSLQLLCGINTSDSPEAQKHIAITIIYYCTLGFEPKKNELSINDLRWTDIEAPENDLDAFEPWSKLILRSIYAGELNVK